MIAGKSRGVVYRLRNKSGPVSVRNHDLYLCAKETFLFSTDKFVVCVIQLTRVCDRLNSSRYKDVTEKSGGEKALLRKEGDA